MIQHALVAVLNDSFKNAGLIKKIGLAMVVGAIVSLIFIFGHGSQVSKKEDVSFLALLVISTLSALCCGLITLFGILKEVAKKSNKISARFIFCVLFYISILLAVSLIIYAIMSELPN